MGSMADAKYLDVAEAITAELRLQQQRLEQLEERDLQRQKKERVVDDLVAQLQTDLCIQSKRLDSLQELLCHHKILENQTDLIKQHQPSKKAGNRGCSVISAAGVHNKQHEDCGRQKQIPKTINSAGFCVGDRVLVTKTTSKFFGRSGVAKKVTSCYVHFAVDGVKHEVFPYLGSSSLKLLEASRGCLVVETLDGATVCR